MVGIINSFDNAGKFQRHINFALTGLCLMALGTICSTANAVTIDLSVPATGQYASYSSNGVTITGSADLDILNGKGMGVLGGDYHTTLGPVVDNGESLLFVFDSGYAASSVWLFNSLVYTPGGPSGSGIDVTGYDVNGNVISTNNMNIPGAGDRNISSLFGYALLSRFDVLAPDDGVQFLRLNFQPVQLQSDNGSPTNNIPAPGTMLIFLTGLFGLLRTKAR